ncbi:MAG: T9SS type A sorting domain-containing protein [Crocinitomicaceae bacterium]|nr:T9SS type A sorting domain-containing protein [Crocinitomicaceae bacterium]
MKSGILFLVFLALFVVSFGQHQIGHTTITFNDPARTGGFGSGGGPGRQIQTEIYYPASVAGEDVELASLSHPLIVFGHGFAMTWEAYQNIWEEYVPMGYIIAFPRTESGLFPGPSHSDFALDLALVKLKIQALNLTVGSIFYDGVKPNSAIMGHSMGGGATILAGDNTSATLKTIIGLAPAETSPSAIADAANVTIPALIFSGVQDGVTPPIDHHIPIYNALASDCKTLVSITGGAHCYFANTNFNCDFGESTSSTGISISRAEQQQTTYSLLTPWLEFYLKENCDAFDAFEDSLASVSGITSQGICSYVPLNVSATLTHINTGGDGAIDVTITDGAGTINFVWSNFNPTEDQSNLNEGNYTIVVSDDYCTVTNNYLILGPAALAEEQKLQVVVYPNPGQSTININLSEAATEVISIELHDAVGRIILSESIQKGTQTHEMNLTDCSTGIYFLVLKNKSGESQTLKIQIQ